LAHTKNGQLAIGDLLKLIGVPSNANLAIGIGLQESFEFKLVDPKKLSLTDFEISDAVEEVLNDAEDGLFNYEEFYVVQEGILASGIEFRLRRGSKLAATLTGGTASLFAATQPSAGPADAVAKAAPSTLPAGLRVDGNRESNLTLKANFASPLFVFVRLHKVDNRVRSKLKNSFAAGVSGDFEIVSTQLGETVTKVVRGPQFMLAQKNGPFGEVHSTKQSVDILLPDGAILLDKSAAFNTNQKQSGVSLEPIKLQGSRVVVTGEVRGNDKAWGERTWGSLDLTVKYQLPPTTRNAELHEQLRQEAIVHGPELTVDLPTDKPLPKRLWVKLRDIGIDGKEQTVAIDYPPNGQGSQQILDGRFVAEISGRRLLIRRANAN
jgi:hypothetical protein